MNLYSIEKNNKLKAIKKSPFTRELGIQRLIENNIKELFGLVLIKSELSFKASSSRVDSLCFDPKTKSFVIIEYKKGKDKGMIEQGLSYLSYLKRHESEFITEYNETFDQLPPLKRKAVCWEKSRVILSPLLLLKNKKNAVKIKSGPLNYGRSINSLMGPSL